MQPLAVGWLLMEPGACFLWLRSSPATKRRKADAAAYLASISESFWNEFDGIWLVKTDERATEIRDRVRCLSGPNDGVAVALLSGFAAWHGFDAKPKNGFCNIYKNHRRDMPRVIFHVEGRQDDQEKDIPNIAAAKCPSERGIVS